jgi:hypothetical protein
MNDPNPIPPPIPVSAPKRGPEPLGQSPDELAPIAGPVSAFEAMLRQPRRVLCQLRQDHPGPLVGRLFCLATLCSLCYGVVIGAFSGGTQLWAAPVKIAAGLLLSGFICLPSLYIFSCLSGAQARLVDVLGLLGGTLCLLSVLLIGFAPVAWVFSQSTESVAAMGALHLLFGLIAVGFGLRFLHTGFMHLLAKSRGGLATWIVIFVLVLLQMTTALRPIVGRADTFLPNEKKFFLQHWAQALAGGPASSPQPATRAEAGRR